MAAEGKGTSPERDQTDESLRAERKETDRALAELQATVEEHADAVVVRAREHADAVLTVAREKADQLLAEARRRTASAPAILAEERATEDEVLRDERAAADEVLRREREDEAAALSKLLPLERDKTDRYLLTERVRSDDALAVRDDFLGIVSHDLRNLLGGIVMSASLLADSASETGADNALGKETLAGTKRIQRYAARMNRLIGDLVDVASIDAGKLSITTARGDATTLIAEALESFQAAAASAGISLATELAGALMADFDRERMLQVLANLIANSLKFTARGGKIRVHGKRTADELHFAVSDDGVGIPANMLEAIFERFWQVGKNDRRGVGLGLYISKCIVEAHGGRIWAESMPRVGCSIWFTLPAPRPTAP
jgi:signal transduction histidine kinase